MERNRFPETCGICSTPVLYTGDYQGCLKCDLMLEWPTVGLHPSVLFMAHSLGVSKIREDRR